MSTLHDIVLIVRDISQIAGDLVRNQIDRVVDNYKETQTRLMNWLLVVLVAIFLAIGGLGLIVYGIHVQLASMIGPAASGILLGIVLILIAAIIFLLARSKLQD
jgi:polyferredoxin